LEGSKTEGESEGRRERGREGGEDVPMSSASLYGLYSLTTLSSVVTVSISSSRDSSDSGRGRKRTWGGEGGREGGREGGSTAWVHGLLILGDEGFSRQGGVGRGPEGGRGGGREGRSYRATVLVVAHIERLASQKLPVLGQGGWKAPEEGGGDALQGREGGREGGEGGMSIQSE